MESINVFEIRNKVKKNIDFMEGAWVEFYDDLTVDMVIKAQSVQTESDILSNLSIIVEQISSWNLADDKGLMEVTIENMQRLPLKVLTWMGKTQGEILGSIADKKKESLDN